MSRYDRGEVENNAITTSGSYIGNNSANRGIPHGLKKKPNHMLMSRDNYTRVWKIIIPGVLEFMLDTASVFHAVTEWDDTYFYVGNASNYGESANSNPAVYSWVCVA